MSDDVMYRHEGQIAIITLNRPASRNAFNLGLREGLLAAVTRANADEGVAAVVIEGAGSGFSSGADLFEEQSDDFDVGVEIERVIKPTLLGIMASPKPYIAAVNGGAVGVGCGLALACDLVVMAQDAYMLFAFASVGLAPDGGTSWQLVHHVGPRRAFEILTSGERLIAERCYTLGLANRVVEASALGQICREQAGQLVLQPRNGLMYAKQTIAQVSTLDIGAAISLEASLQSAAMRGDEFLTARRNFIERKPSR